MPRYFLDTEFIDDGSTIDLISVGIVCDDGRELYLQSIEYDPTNAGKWVKENVLNHLVKCPVNNESDASTDWAYHTVTHGECGAGRMGQVTCPWRSSHHMRSEIFTFMDAIKYGKPELWGWCSGYDFVALCQLFGTMMDLPQNWPHYICDFQYVLDGRGITDDMLPSQEGTVHNALQDARYLKQLWGYIVRNDAWQ